jgi:RHS repeat-associated protein
MYGINTVMTPLVPLCLEGSLLRTLRYYNKPYGYNGEAHDMDSGLQFLRARYYDPSMGRFISRDSYLGSIMQPLSLNRYDYTQNNPVMNAGKGFF